MKTPVNENTNKWIAVDCCSSVLMLRPHRFGTVFLHLYALLTVSVVLGLSSRLTCSHFCSRSTVHASDTLTSVFRAL